MDVGPVIGIEDVVGSKTAALASRAEVRDYVDVAAALGRFSREQLIAFACASTGCRIASSRPTG